MKRFAVAVLFTVAVSATGQDNKFPTPHHEKLNVMVGNWDVAVNHKGPDGKYHEGTATCEGKWELDGMVLVQKYNSKLPGGKEFNVVQTLGYDSGKKKGYEVHYNNMHTSLVHNEGDFSADGKTLTHMGMHPDDKTKEMKKLKTVYTFTDADHFTIEWFTGDGDQPERGVSLKHTRKK